MPKIELTTEYEAPIQVVLDANRYIDLHELSAVDTNEKTIDRKTNGLIEKEEWATWRARHFGFYQEFTLKITRMEAPIYFRDEMKKVILKRFTHDHYFETIERKTKMYEVFEFESPFGVLGKLADRRFLKSYIK